MHSSAATHLSARKDIQHWVKRLDEIEKATSKTFKNKQEDLVDLPKQHRQLFEKDPDVYNDLFIRTKAVLEKLSQQHIKRLAAAKESRIEAIRRAAVKRAADKLAAERMARLAYLRDGYVMPRSFKTDLIVYAQRVEGIKNLWESNYFDTPNDVQKLEFLKTIHKDLIEAADLKRAAVETNISAEPKDGAIFTRFKPMLQDETLVGEADKTWLDLFTEIDNQLRRVAPVKARPKKRSRMADDDAS